MKYILILFSLALLPSCAYFRAEPPPPPPQINVYPVTRAVIDTSLQFELDYDIHLKDSRLDGEDTIDRIELNYISQELLDIRAARRVAVKTIDSLIDRFNQDIDVYSQLTTQPFSVDELGLEIHFESYFGKYVDPFYVERVILSDGWLHYYAFTAYDPAPEVWHYHTEPYESSSTIISAEDEFNENHPVSVKEEEYSISLESDSTAFPATSKSPKRTTPSTALPPAPSVVPKKPNLMLK